MEESSIPRENTAPWHIFQSDWEGESLPFELSCRFGLVEREGQKSFMFAVKGEGMMQTHPDAKPNDFTAELWRYDVAEFFLGRTDSPAYWEFNLAVNGAWWSQGFSSYRRPLSSSQEPFAGVLTQARQKGNSWQVRALIPMDNFKGLHLESMAFNATAIIASPKQRFVTLQQPPEGSEPDFHLTVLRHPTHLMDFF